MSDDETAVRTTLMAFVGFAGIGVTIALLIRWGFNIWDSKI